MYISVCILHIVVSIQLCPRKDFLKRLSELRIKWLCSMLLVFSMVLLRTSNKPDCIFTLLLSRSSSRSRATGRICRYGDMK